MVNTAVELTSPSPEDSPVKFEQPLTERMRTFLRLELLYRQAVFHTSSETDLGTRAAVTSLLEILSILSRGDVRAEVLKELDRHAELLSHYRQTPGVDSARLNGLIDEIGALKEDLAAVGSNFVGPLKEHEFLNAIKHRSSIPGGTCVFDLPDYGYWLHLPHSERAEQLDQWVDRLRPLCESVAEVLWLTRESNEPAERVAYNGLYHHSLDRNEQFNLVRVMLPARSGMYPEISAGKHRFTIRFVEWQGVDSRPTQVSSDVEFLLALC